MKGINVKVDEKSKSKENVKVEEEVKVEVKEEKASDGYAFIRKDKEGKMFLLKETALELESMHESRQKIEQELNVFLLQEKIFEKDKEILALRTQILDRELNDIKSAKSFKMEQKRRENIKHTEYVDKIRKEVGHKTFSLSDEDEILIGVN